eukprot:TRINITY_DN33466_c0_g1_i1.p1 TRINITY_DN33466_c0_g1~~TRINITY_DN33466_c0_g1_i1.p1  ORF type:complete len:256 (-),score=17.25 TRINITY_DN33466_c0_g1_i1:194-847(-)
MAEGEDHSSKERIHTVSVSKINGDVFQCLVDEDCTVDELLNLAVHDNDDDAVLVHKVHNNPLEIVLVDEAGVEMERHMKLSEYGLCADSSVMMVRRPRVRGVYNCWVQVDLSRVHPIDNVRFSLEIERSWVSVNGIKGRTSTHSSCDGVWYSVAFEKPLNIRSGLPGNRKPLEATSCEFVWKSGDYSQPCWFPIEGKLQLRGSKESREFKGRFRQPL